MTTEHHTQAGALQLRSVTKNYDAKQGQHRAVDSINLDIEAGKFVTFLGPSGCGKTTTLRMIAGFEDVTEGEITLDGQSLVSVPPEKRPMSMVFQSYALFPHLTVKDNVGFGLNYQKLSAAEREQRIADGLALMGIEQYAHRYPHQLSGGQQQRANATFQGSDAVFDYFLGGVVHAGVNGSQLGESETVCGLLCTVKDIRGGLVDG